LIGDERNVMYQVGGVAGVALGTDQPGRAARLLGAIAAFQEASGFTAVFSDPAIVEIMLATKAALGAEAFQRLWEAGRAMPWPDAVADALAVLDAGVSPPPHTVHTAPASQVEAFDLTRREREILTFLCQRLTDHEIADALFISPYTASKHVSNVLGKLGVANRREAAALAARHALV
jgi:DNA-binding CsgD family transcriptional regulator